MQAGKDAQKPFTFYCFKAEGAYGAPQFPQRAYGALWSPPPPLKYPQGACGAPTPSPPSPQPKNLAVGGWGGRVARHPPLLNYACSLIVLIK